jgi:K+-transporting ATPase A subunit
MNKFSLFILFLLLSMQGFAQDQAPEMADALRSSGKIYVVVCVAAIVLVGLIIYLITIDRKVSKLEKEMSSQKSDKTS